MATNKPAAGNTILIAQALDLDLEQVRQALQETP